MLVTIRHLPREAYRDMSCIYDDSERLEFAKEQLKNNNYIRVADLETTAVCGLIDSLEIGYKATNSVEEAWYLDENISVANEAKEGCRSTSVGDIIQIGGISYMVAGCGFKEI